MNARALTPRPGLARSWLALTMLLAMLAGTASVSDAFAVDADWTSVTADGRTLAVTATNVARGADELIVSTPTHGSTTRTNEWGAEAVVISGKVTALQDRQTTRASATPIPTNDTVQDPTPAPAPAPAPTPAPLR